MFHFEVFLAELDDVIWVLSNHLLAEVFKDLGELVWDNNLISAEDAHLANVCHIRNINFKL